MSELADGQHQVVANRLAQEGRCRVADLHILFRAGP